MGQECDTLTDVEEACKIISDFHARDPSRWGLDLTKARKTMPPEELLRRGLSVWDPGVLRHPDPQSDEKPITLIILQPMTKVSIERDYCSAATLALFFFHNIDDGRSYELPRLTRAAES